LIECYTLENVSQEVVERLPKFTFFYLKVIMKQFYLLTKKFHLCWSRILLRYKNVWIME